MDTIWARLDCKYSDKCKLLDKIMSDKMSIFICHNSDSSKILEFIKTVRNANIDLRLMGKEDELHNSTILEMIKEKLRVKFARKGQQTNNDHLYNKELQDPKAVVILTNPDLRRYID